VRCRGTLQARNMSGIWFLGLESQKYWGILSSIERLSILGSEGCQLANPTPHRAMERQTKTHPMQECWRTTHFTKTCNITYTRCKRCGQKGDKNDHPNHCTQCPKTNHPTQTVPTSHALTAMPTIMQQPIHDAPTFNTILTNKKGLPSPHALGTRLPNPPNE
jgi:hypothetical protein